MNTSKLAAFCLAAMLSLGPAVQAKRMGTAAPGAAQPNSQREPAGAVMQESARLATPSVAKADEPGEPLGAGRGGMLAGLATGLGVATLFHGFGVGEQAAGWFSVVLVSALLVLLGWGLWRLLRRAAPAAPAPLALQGASAPATRSSFASSHYEPATLAPESSVHYGAGGIDEVASRTGEFRWGVPKGFDALGFRDRGPGRHQRPGEGAQGCAQGRHRGGRQGGCRGSAGARGRRSGRGQRTPLCATCAAAARFRDPPRRLGQVVGRGRPAAIPLPQGQRRPSARRLVRGRGLIVHRRTAIRPGCR